MSPGAIEAVPAVAAELFGDRLDLAARYAQLLCGAGVERGVIGPREPARIWSRHLLNCAALGDALPGHVSVLDLGSGAGLPGIPLALARPDLSITLLEPSERRCTFLQEAVAALALDIDVVRARAESATTPPVDVVVARAVSTLPRLAELARPLARPGGELLAVKGSKAQQEADEYAHDTSDTVSVERHGPVDAQVTVVRVVFGTRLRHNDRRSGTTMRKGTQ